MIGGLRFNQLVFYAFFLYVGFEQRQLFLLSPGKHSSSLFAMEASRHCACWYPATMISPASPEHQGSSHPSVSLESCGFAPHGVAPVSHVPVGGVAGWLVRENHVFFFPQTFQEWIIVDYRVRSFGSQICTQFLSRHP